MGPHFSRIAIINRGEPAIRFIRAVRQFNRETQTQLRTIVLYTDPDRRARFVQEADEAVYIGEATFFDNHAGQCKPVYVDHERIKHALLECGANAVWVGWGFVSENPGFAEMCARIGLTFIGPDSNSMRLLGNKISAKCIAARLGVPVIPWCDAAADTAEIAIRQARSLGYPVVIKPAVGEGGRGIRKIQSESELLFAFQSSRNEALRAFGDQTVYVEKWMEGARHVEVQILADGEGTTWSIGVRDCTVQRRHQKVVEEAPANAVTPEQDRWLRKAAVAICQEARYRNAGTVEFLFDPATQRFTFLEVNARLQVEHAVTELTTGLDIVKLQLHIARGGRLEGEPPATQGHAIEVRLNAEDTEDGFAPAPGRMEVFRIPILAGLRLDSGVAEGDEIPAEFDSMFAKLISYGRNRDEALATLGRALEESAIILAGGATNRAFLTQLINREEIRKDHVDVGWLDRETAAHRYRADEYADVALMKAAIDVYTFELEAECEQFFATAMRMRPVIRTDAGRPIELRHRGHRYKFRVFRHSIEHYRVDTDEASFDVEISPGGRYEQWLTYDGRRYHVLSVIRDLTHFVEVDGCLHKISRDVSGNIRASAPSVVVSIDVRPGDQVAAGERLALLEAMKMEMPVVAPFAGIVRETFVLSNAQVGLGAPLLRLEPQAPGQSEETDRIVLRPSRPVANKPEVNLRTTLAELRHIMLGADLHPAEAKKLVEDYNLASQSVPADNDELNHSEDDILRAYIDICTLFRRQAPPEDIDDAGRLSASEYLHSYLRALDGRGASLPASFIEKLRRALRHFGDDSLEPTSALKTQLLLIYKAYQTMDLRIPVITAILERRLAYAGNLGEQSFPVLLDRLDSVSEGRFPALSELAREIKYRLFDLPAFERIRNSVFAEMDHHLNYLIRSPNAADRTDRIAALVQCSQPLLMLLTSRLLNAPIATRRLLLEVLTWRFYHIRNIETVTTLESQGRCMALTKYGHNGSRIHLISADAGIAEISDAIEALLPQIARVPADEDVALDLYVLNPGQLGDPDETEAALSHVLNRTAFPRPLRRIVLCITSPESGIGAGRTMSYTYRPSAEGYREERIYRGLHPMVNKRLQLWRLSNFNLERLPAAEDVYFFHGVARENPRDERLFAIAEVRDMTPVRDARGRIVRLPHLERMLTEILAAIRHIQLQRALEERLHWNRVLLLIRPLVDLNIEELQLVIRRMARQTEGLGLEKVVVRFDQPDPQTGNLQSRILSFSNPGGRGLVFRLTPPTDQLIRPLSEYDQKVVRMRQRGLNYPYEIIRTLISQGETINSEMPPGEFKEYDLDAAGALVPVTRPYGRNTANIVVGLIRNITPKYPEGMARVILLGDPSKEMGSIAEPECRRILAALELARSRKLPLEWFTHSAGAKIAMESGTETMDWIARVLRGLINFTQDGGEVNILVAGVNVGAQPYWNAEATMLMHTRGILVMMPESAMVLTGKTALDYSGSVSAEDNQGIGGYERIMGPNGQAQYWARDIAAACQILLRHYDHSYIAPGERFPRRGRTTDPSDRDVCQFPHASNGEGFALVGHIFSDEHNPGRKKPFEIRKVMLAVTDQDHRPLERWAGMEDAENAVVWDAHIGGIPVCLIGIESHPLPRTGFVATDGPEQWTSGTLFPMASKKIARAVNAASNNRALVVLANLSGFDGSPESMRRRQLEFGAEIGRAVVNFQGPIVFCVISRYHGGAFVVFSRALNENIEAVALEGTYASVIGGAPAAAVVFSREVDKRTRTDARIATLEKEIAAATGGRKRELLAQLTDLREIVRSEKLGEVAEQFDRIHSVQRALKVESLDRIIPPSQLRPYLIDAIERGMRREVERAQSIAPDANSEF